MAKVVVFLVVLIGIAVMMNISPSSAFEFRVGGPQGWKKPTGEETETFNQWAGRNRFHIGDSLYFNYANDSVLVVSREDYANCNTTNPVLKFADGNTTFWFDRHGYFYFVSGEADHCKAGEKLIVRVMVHPFVYPGPAPAPYPMSGGGSWPGSGASASPAGAPWNSASSAWKVAVGGYSALAGLAFSLVVLMFA